MADIGGLGKLAYDIVVINDLSDAFFKVILLVVVFVFGMGLGVLSIRGFDNWAFRSVARFFAWVYLGIACLSYFGITVVLYRQAYSIEAFGTFVLVMITELLAILSLHVVIEDHDIRPFSYPIFAVAAIQAFLALHRYVLVSVPVSAYLAGDLFFFLGMTLVGSAMLGDIAFASLIKRVIDEIRGRDDA